MATGFGEILDTSPEARASYYDMVSRLTPGQRAEKVAALGRTARELARAGIRLGRPDASPLDVELELVARLYGADVARRLAPHLASRHG